MCGFSAKTIAALDPELRLNLDQVEIELQAFPDDTWLLAQEVKPDPTLLGVREGSRVKCVQRVSGGYR